MQIYIKNMVCSLCKTTVQKELAKLNIEYSKIELGKVVLQDNKTDTSKLDHLDTALKKWGLEILGNPETILIEKIICEIISLVYYNENDLKMKLSSYLTEKINCSYDYMSHVFKKNKGITIENFFIIHKIKRVKELTVYNNLSLSEIAHRLHYSSLAHLSGQFKKVTGITFNEFRRLKQKRLHEREIILS